MQFHGAQWDPMNSHGTQWNHMGLPGNICVGLKKGKRGGGGGVLKEWILECSHMAPTWLPGGLHMALHGKLMIHLP